MPRSADRKSGPFSRASRAPVSPSGRGMYFPVGLSSVAFFFSVCSETVSKISEQLLTVDPSARASMKNAASCDT